MLKKNTYNLISIFFLTKYFFCPYKFHPFYFQANHSYLFSVFIFVLYPVFILTFLSNRLGRFLIYRKTPVLPF